MELQNVKSTPSTSSQQNSEIAATQMVSIKPPEFMDTAVDGWFVILNSQFHLRNITTSKTKFYTALAALPADLVSRLPSYIVESENYDSLKDKVISIYEETKPELLDKLLNQTTFQGRPSEKLQKIMKLASKVNVGDDIIKHRFLQILPPNVATVMASQKDLNLQQWGKLADELSPYFNTSQPCQVMNVNQSNSSSSNSSQNNNHDSKPKKNFGKGKFSQGLAPFYADQRPKICRAHLYFAEKAKFCKPWCKWPVKTNCQIQPNSRSSSPARSEN